MQVLRTRAEWRAATNAVRSAGGTIGFVPTMGALHRGHQSLLDVARGACDAVAMSIFVNPLQFNDPEDIARYPRPLEKDLDIAGAAGCDLVFVPEVTEIYPSFPEMPATTVRVAGPALGFEGADRPGHFDGVATVVTLLFELTGPCRGFFGEKDFQQVAVVTQMVRDLGMPVEVVPCPTVRESDGLALSSRNVRLSPEGRTHAAVFSRSLRLGKELLSEGVSVDDVETSMANEIAAEPTVTLFYAVCVDPITLQPVRQSDHNGEVQLLVAGEVDGVRLLDNMRAHRSDAA